MDEEVMEPYIEPAMTRLVALLRGSPDKSVQDDAISGISAVATVAGPNFMPFYPAVLDMMKQLSQITEVSTIELRGRAIECASLVGLAIGKALFAPHLEFFIQQARSSLRMGDDISNELREFILSFYGNLAELAGEDFITFIPDILPTVLSGLTQPAKPQASPVPILAGVLDFNTGDGQVDNAFVDAKTQALTTISIFAYRCRTRFVPFIEVCLKPVLFFLKYVHPALRKAAILPAEAFITTIGKAFPSAAGKKWLPGVPLASQPMSLQFKQITDAILPIYMEAIEKDPIPEVVMTHLESLVQLTKQFGPCIIEAYHEPLSKLLLSLMKGGLLCQLPEDDDEEQYYDDEGENEQQLFNIVLHGLELVLGFAHVFQTRWAFYLPLVDNVITLMGSDAPKIRREAVGTVAEIVERLGDNAKLQLQVPPRSRAPRVLTSWCSRSWR